MLGPRLSLLRQLFDRILPARPTMNARLSLPRPAYAFARTRRKASPAAMNRWAREYERRFALGRGLIIGVVVVWALATCLAGIVSAQENKEAPKASVIELAPPQKSSRNQTSRQQVESEPLDSRRVRIGDGSSASDEAQDKMPRLLHEAVLGDDSRVVRESEDMASPHVANRLPRAEDPWTASEMERAPVSPELLGLSRDIRQTIGWYHEQHERVEKRSPWGVMHAMIAFEADSVVRVQGRPVNALGWLCWNGACAGNQLMMVRRGGLMARSGPGLQGHEGQFLAMLAQCGVRADNELRVAGHSFTVADLVRYEQWNCQAGTELTFKLIGLSYYLDTDEEWQSSSGETWSLERLIQEELKQPVVGAACGGTHRMMGYSFALRQREREGRPIEGQWARARQFVDDFLSYTFQLQNPDGSFSTEWFEGRAARDDVERRLQTTGHILEWLVFSVPSSDLDDPRIIRAVVYLNALMWQGRQHDWEVGPKGHALHALRLYHLRRFGTTGLGAEGQPTVEVGTTRVGR